MSDLQRSRLYRAEQSMRRENAVALQSIEHVRALVRIAESLPWYPSQRKGCGVATTMATGHAYWSNGVIHLPAKGAGADGSWAWTDIVILHELAHHLTFTEGGNWHGEAFATYFLRLVRSLRPEAVGDALAAAFNENNIKYTDRKEVAA